MGLRPGDIARGVVALGLPLAGGALATYGELIWGAAAVALLAAVPPARRYAAPAGAVFGLLVLARVGAAVPARGVTAVLLGLAAIVAVAYVLALGRRKDARPSDVRWAAALAAVAAVAAAGVALLFGPPTLNLMLVPLAALAALAVPAGGDRVPRAAFVALAAGLALGAGKGAAGFALTARAEGALARSDYAAAGEYARWAAALAPGARADLLRLQAEAGSGAPWRRLEGFYERRDRFASPRHFDAALAAAAFARGDYEKAAMYGDLATTPSPTSPVRDEAIPRGDVYDAFVDRSGDAFARAWADLWRGDYARAAAAFAALAPSDPGARWYQAFALESAGDREAAAAVYEDMWRSDHGRLRAGFGLLRTRKYRGLRGEIWRELIKRYEYRVVGTDIKTASGFRLSKGRLALGQTPATFTYNGKGWRSLVVIAESYGVKGLYPIVTIAVNGDPVRAFYADVPGENVYEAEVFFERENNEVGLLFEDDFFDPTFGYNRDIFVREVRLGRGVEKR
jgi:tetratricopeptide (TPR) repeat protein